MQYDPDLANRLGVLPTESFSGEVYRVTRVGADPVAPSLYGGRWARPQNDDPGTSVLYTSMERDGAMAEIASFLAEQTPIPGPRQLQMTRLAVTTSKTLRLAVSGLTALGVDMNRYGERDHARTQEIGSTLAWLGLDGLIAPSARWTCDNLMIFTDSHALGETLEPIASELVEWREWAEAHGIIRIE
jgi:hypothetical protein